MEEINRFHHCFLVMIPTFVGRCFLVKILQVLLVKFQCVLVHILFLPVKLRQFFGQLVIGTPWMVTLTLQSFATIGKVSKTLL